MLCMHDCYIMPVQLFLRSTLTKMLKWKGFTNSWKHDSGRVHRIIYLDHSGCSCTYKISSTSKEKFLRGVRWRDGLGKGRGKDTNNRGLALRVIDTFWCSFNRCTYCLPKNQKNKEKRYSNKSFIRRTRVQFIRGLVWLCFKNIRGNLPIQRDFCKSTAG